MVTQALHDLSSCLEYNTWLSSQDQNIAQLNISKKRKKKKKGKFLPEQAFHKLGEAEVVNVSALIYRHP